MERAARSLLLFSFACLLLVLAFGTLRGVGPVRAWLATEEAARTAMLFHSHFDQLCWLGAAAAGAAMWILRDAYRGPDWAPAVFARTYAGGALLFSTAFGVKLVAERLGASGVARIGFGVLVSVGGALLLVALASGAVLVRGLVGARATRTAVD